MNAREFEFKVVDSYLKYCNGKTGTNFQFVNRPDEADRNTKAPDFKYSEPSSKRSLFIEIGRIIGVRLAEFNGSTRIFRPLVDALKGKLPGSFLLSIDHKTARKHRAGRARRAWFSEIEAAVVSTAPGIAAGAVLTIGEGVKLRTLDGEGADLYVAPDVSFLTPVEEQQALITVFKEARDKFADCVGEGNTTQLIVIDGDSRHDEITDLIKCRDLPIFGESFELTNIDEVYEIDLPSEWEKPAGISMCYPKVWSTNWCTPAQLFKDRKDYFYTHLAYFMGYRGERPSRNP